MIEVHEDIKIYQDEEDGSEIREPHVSCGKWSSYNSAGTLVLSWGGGRRAIWCPPTRKCLDELIALYERQIELDKDVRG